jgi:uncharacterized protein YjbJ (UPF0337 family)
MANRDQVKGKIDNLKGRVKQAAGSVSGDKELEAEGAAERIKGAAQEKLGDVKHKVAEDIEEDDESEEDEKP